MPRATSQDYRPRTKWSVHPDGKVPRNGGMKSGHESVPKGSMGRYSSGSPCDELEQGDECTEPEVRDDHCTATEREFHSRL